MLTLLPVIVLSLTALAVLLLRRLERGTGFAWLAGVTLALITWGGVLWLHWLELPALQMIPWRPFDPQAADQIIFAWDDVSWALGFALVSLVLGLLFTAPARLQHRSSPVTWAANLAITAIGLLAVLAASPMATVLAWTLLDIVELVLILRLIEGERIPRQAVVSFGAKVAGTLVMLWAMIQSHKDGGALTYASLPASSAVFLLLAAGLRLGVLPLNQPFPVDLPLQRGLSNAVRMATQASSLAILARLPADIFTDFWQSLLLLLAALAAFYASAMWATAKNELDGRQYWSLSMAGFALAAALHGNQQAVVTWGMVLIISGSIITFYSARSKPLLFLPLLGLIGLAGLPFTPAAAGIAGFAAAPFHLWDLIFILNLALMIAGYARLSLMAGDSLADLERWVLGVYPPGLILLALSGWLIAALGFPGGLSAGIWWASILALILAAPAFWLLRLIKYDDAGALTAPGRAESVVTFFRSMISPVLRLSWLYRLLWLVFAGFQRLLRMITRVLEGQAGVLWALLLVALLLTVLAGGGFLR